MPPMQGKAMTTKVRKGAGKRVRDSWETAIMPDPCDDGRFHSLIIMQGECSAASVKGKG
jgi:hypothetical protein